MIRPLVDVGKMTLNRNVVDTTRRSSRRHSSPTTPDKMLLARGFSYADVHRARLGVNYRQIPVNEPKVEFNA